MLLSVTHPIHYPESWITWPPDWNAKKGFYISTPAGQRNAGSRCLGAEMTIMTTNPLRWKHRHYRHWSKNSYRKLELNATKQTPKPVKNPEQKKVLISLFFKTPHRGHGFRCQKSHFFIRGLYGLDQGASSFEIVTILCSGGTQSE